MRRCAAAAASASVAFVLHGCGGGHAPAPVLPAACATTTTTTRSSHDKRWQGYKCSSTRKLKSKVEAPEKKGFAVDDPTLALCSEQLVAHWPHCPAEERVASLRLFSSWKKWWKREDRNEAWERLKIFLDNNHAKVLLGLDMLCEKGNDAWEWEQTFELIKFLGADRIMGLAFGNEMDNKAKCRKGFINGDFFTQMKGWVDAMDAEEGLQSIPVTVVWAMGVLGKEINVSQHSFEPELEPFLRQAHEEWGTRFVWTFNPYPLWDLNIMPTSKKDCKDAISAATGAYTPGIMGVCRGRIANFTNGSESIVWAGESGWSSPVVKAQKRIDAFCPEWASEETLFKFYESMMTWDLSVPNDAVTGKKQRGVDHLFFFTMRDFNGESFGLVKECCQTECKIQQSTTTTAEPSTTTATSTAAMTEKATMTEKLTPSAPDFLRVAV